MKVKFTFFILFISAMTCFGQNLQFNQAKLVTSQETVPVGKVWKVESVLGDVISSSCSTQPMHKIIINGNQITVSQNTNIGFNTYCNGWSGIVTVTKLPIWLPAGSTLASSFNVFSVNVIEFNIVP
jgi:hypothetical protein